MQAAWIYSDETKEQITRIFEAVADYGGSTRPSVPLSGPLAIHPYLWYGLTYEDHSQYR
jgi:hypothetical protein